MDAHACPSYRCRSCPLQSDDGERAHQASDPLVSSSAPGYAMRGTNRDRMFGAVVGKALEPLSRGRGVIQVLVTLQ